jgi:hypothetical protein
MRHALVSLAIIALLGSSAALSSEYDTGHETIECETQPHGDQQSEYFVVNIDVTNKIVKIWQGNDPDKINPEDIREHPIDKLMLNLAPREDAFGVTKTFKFVDIADWRGATGHMWEYDDHGSSFGRFGTQSILRYDGDHPQSPTNWFVMCQIVENTVK